MSRKTDLKNNRHPSEVPAHEYLGLIKNFSKAAKKTLVKAYEHPDYLSNKDKRNWSDSHTILSRIYKRNAGRQLAHYLKYYTSHADAVEAKKALEEKKKNEGQSMNEELQKHNVYTIRHPQASELHGKKVIFSGTRKNVPHGAPDHVVHLLNKDGTAGEEWLVRKHHIMKESVPFEWTRVAQNAFISEDPKLAVALTEEGTWVVLRPDSSIKYILDENDAHPFNEAQDHDLNVVVGLGDFLRLDTPDRAITEALTHFIGKQLNEARSVSGVTPNDHVGKTASDFGANQKEYKMTYEKHRGDHIEYRHVNIPTPEGGHTTPESIGTMVRRSPIHKKLIADKYNINAFGDHVRREKAWGKPVKIVKEAAEPKPPYHINHPLYNTAQKMPKWNVQVSPVSGDYDTSGKILKQRMKGYSKDDHLAAAKHHLSQGKKAKSLQNKMMQKAYVRLLKNKVDPGPLISGIGSERIEDKTKDRLRKLADISNRSTSAGFAHFKAAGKKLTTAQKSYQELNSK